jgi:hypothetical protein
VLVRLCVYCQIQHIKYSKYIRTCRLVGCGSNRVACQTAVALVSRLAHHVVAYIERACLPCQGNTAAHCRCKFCFRLRCSCCLYGYMIISASLGATYQLLLLLRA